MRSKDVPTTAWLTARTWDPQWTPMEQVAIIGDIEHDGVAPLKINARLRPRLTVHQLYDFVTKIVTSPPGEGLSAKALERVGAEKLPDGWGIAFRLKFVTPSDIEGGAPGLRWSYRAWTRLWTWLNANTTLLYVQFLTKEQRAGADAAGEPYYWVETTRSTPRRSPYNASRLHPWTVRGQMIDHRAASKIKAAYRGMRNRRRADAAREVYYRPGGRGYRAARTSFYATAAATNAARRLR